MNCDKEVVPELTADDTENIIETISTGENLI
jgi:hypothetical protein